jgi:uncharacterized membrane protein
MVRNVLLFVHVTGVVLWLGLALSLAFVTARARKEGGPEVAAFAYRTSDRLMRTMGLAGMLLTIGGGVGLVMALPQWSWFQPFPDHWLFQMQLLGFAVFALAALYQLPLGRKLADAAEESARRGEATGEFETYRKRHAIVASINGFVLLLLVLLGTVRPG